MTTTCNFKCSKIDSAFISIYMLVRMYIHSLMFTDMVSEPFEFPHSKASLNKVSTLLISCGFEVMLAIK
jgi:hypothetical protein